MVGVLVRLLRIRYETRIFLERDDNRTFGTTANIVIYCTSESLREKQSYLI